MSSVLSLLSTTSTSDPSLHTAITSALDAIESSLHLFPHPGELCLSFNGGKDSTVVLYLLLAVLHRRGISYASPPTPSPLPRIVYFSPSGTELTSAAPCPHSFPAVTAFMHACQGTHALPLEEHAGFKQGLSTLVSAGVRGVLMGTRCGDPDAAQLRGPFAPTSLSWPPALRICPILDWSYGQVWAFLRGAGLPYCSLYDEGYTSLGSPGDSAVNPALAGAGGAPPRPAWQLEDGRLERAGRGKRG